MKNNFLGKLVKVFVDREVSDFPPEVSDSALYSYSNFRGAEITSFGPRDETKKAEENESEVNALRSQPQLEFCRY